MSANRHLVARVVWDSAFDVPAELRAQQDWLASFSRHALPELMCEVFDVYCPADKTLRCERLDLDLGRISLSHVEQDIPSRLHRALKEALWRQFGLPTADHIDGNVFLARSAMQSTAEPSQVAAVSDVHSSLHVLRHLLMHGSLPWWVSQAPSLASLWDALLPVQGHDLSCLLMQLGRHEGVRERLVWHLGNDRMSGLLSLLFPRHAAVLVEWVHGLIQRHEVVPVVRARSAEFESAAWLTLFTGLLADRGSQSNTAEYVRAHLQQLAAQYGIAYSELLASLKSGCARQETTLPRPFLHLLEWVWSREHCVTSVDQPTGGGAKSWLLCARMLSHGEQRLPQEEGGFTLQQLLMQLVAQDEGRVARLLRQQGSPVSVLLIQTLNAKALQRITAILQPSQADFICCFLRYAHEWAQNTHHASRVLWQGALMRLLDEQAFRFEHARWVESVLQHCCQQYRLDYGSALRHVTGLVQAGRATPAQYALICILQMLQTQHTPGVPMRPVASVWASTWRARTVKKQTHWALDLTGADDLVQAMTLQQRWVALRWYLRCARPAPGQLSRAYTIALITLWQSLPAAELRAWLLRQPDRSLILAQLAGIPDARRWLNRLTPITLRPLSHLLDQASDWMQRAGLWRGNTTTLLRRLEPVAWQLALDARAARMNPAVFLAHCLLHWGVILGLSMAECIDRCLQTAPATPWRDACRQVQTWMTGLPVALPDPGLMPLPASRHRSSGRRVDAWGGWLLQPEACAKVLRQLCQRRPVVRHRQHGVAAWPGADWRAPAEWEDIEQRLAAAVHRLSWLDPVALRNMLAVPWRKAALRPQLEARITLALPWPQLLDLLQRSPLGKPNVLNQLHQWKLWLQRLPMPHADIREQWVWRTVWEAWLHQDWRRLQASELALSFCQYLLPHAGMGATIFTRQLRMASAELQPELAEALLTALSAGHEAATTIQAAKPQHEPVRDPTPTPGFSAAEDAAFRERAVTFEQEPPPGQHLPLLNAGLVLLHSFLPSLFKRMALMDDGQFTSRAAVFRAALCLQYLATGQLGAEEPHLVLNKLLCGLTPQQPAPLTLEMSARELAVLDGMLQAVCDHWPRSGSSNAEALRGNWLLRAGVLSDAGDHWRLTVERKPWDVLLRHCPFTYAVIKLPWMAKALYVTWPY